MAEGNGRNIRLINPLRNLLYGLPEETKKTIRQFLKVALRINSTELAVIFNKTCIREREFKRRVLEEFDLGIVDVQQWWVHNASVIRRHGK